MACFSLTLIEQLLIWVVIFIAVYSILMLVIPFATAGATGRIAAVINVVVEIFKIVFWAAVVIVVIVFAFHMIQCLIGQMPALLPHR